MRIVALVDAAAVCADDPSFDGKTPASRAAMEGQVLEALRGLGHEVAVVPFGPDIEETLRALKAPGIGLVFNLTEEFGGDRRKDLHVAALLELLGLPYTGSTPTGLNLCRDKATCKRILGYHRIRVPAFVTLPVGTTRPPGRFRYPAIVKPLFEDGSEGISLASVVRDAGELRERAHGIHERLKQPAICEEYIEGRELYVGIIGNHQLRALPPRELIFGRSAEGGPRIATARVKWDAAYRRKWDISCVHAELPEKTGTEVARAGKRIYRILRISDYGRVDLRLTPANEIVFLEANPNPDLSREDEFAEAAEKAGIPYPQLIERIVHLALKRAANES